MDIILEQMERGEFDVGKMFNDDEESYSKIKSAILQITASYDLSKEMCNNIMITQVLPIIFNSTVTNTVRNQALEVGFSLLPQTEISLLNTAEQEGLFSLIEDKYKDVVGELHDKEDPNWSQLWIFLIKLCGEKLHTRLSLSNKLLRIVENAFRNTSSLDQRLKAYDCWVELINNSSLNMDHMCSPKQIKLLITPMKAKFSRMAPVIVKRCDTFIYLLEKLQKNATLCLKEFLEFGFGPFDDLSVMEKVRQGGSVSEVCHKSSTKVLIEILGHSHADKESCLDTSSIHLYKPLITSSNFPSFAEILISSVVHCCILLDEFSKDPVVNNTVVKCLWHSIFNLIKKSGVALREKCYKQINDLIWKLFEESPKNHRLYRVLHNIVTFFQQDELIQEFGEMVIDNLFNFLCTANPDLSLSVDQIFQFLGPCNTEAERKMFRNKFKDKNLTALGDIWLNCDFKLTPDSVSYLILPITHLKNFTELKPLKLKWSKVYMKCETNDLKFLILNKMEKVFSENPLLGSNVILFVEIIALMEPSPDEHFVAVFMKLIGHILTLPNLSASDVKKLSPIVLKYCNPVFYKANCHNYIDELCSCVERLLAIHKDYSILTKLTNCLHNGKPEILAKYQKALMHCLEGLMLNEDMKICNNTRKLIQLLETKEKKSETVKPPGRSQRIVNMVNKIPRSRSASPNKKPTTPNKIDKKKSTSVLSFADDKSSDYVKIDTKVKIVVDNLSEHQKEMLKRRREDIPALYQDLTQSQSEDFFKRIGEANNSEGQTVINGERSDGDNTTSNSQKRRPIIIRLSTAGTKKKKQEPNIENSEAKTNETATTKSVIRKNTLNEEDLLQKVLIQAAKKELRRSAQQEEMEISDNCEPKTNEEKDKEVEQKISVEVADNSNVQDTSRRKSGRLVNATMKDYIVEMPIKINRKKRRQSETLNESKNVSAQALETNKDKLEVEDRNKNNILALEDKQHDTSAVTKDMQPTQETVVDMSPITIKKTLLDTSWLQKLHIDDAQADNEIACSEMNVYEFVVDNKESKQQQVKKSTKNRSKSPAPFSAQSYKRRRRSKKNKSSVDDHSNGSSSPCGIETITIMMTHTPPSSANESEQTGDEKRSPPKRSPISQDVIESSQAATETVVQKTARISPEAKPEPVADTETKTEATSEDLFPSKSIDESPAATLENVPSTPTKNPNSLTVVLTRLSPKIAERGTINLNQSLVETLTCEPIKPVDVDTLTQNVDDDEQNEVLSGSPIMCDTPDRTIELLNNTSDISPIKAAPEDTNSTPRPRTGEVKNVRVARLLQMANSNVQVSNEGRTWFGNKNSSASKKMKSKMKEDLDILTFSREVPSPLSVPSTGILKRKNSTDETSAPAPKRKRVNFSDPAISEKKIFIKDSEAYNDSLEEENVDKDESGVLKAVNIDNLLLGFKEHDDLEVEDLAGNKKVELKRLLNSMKSSDVAEVIFEYLINADATTVNDLTDTLFTSEASEQLKDKCVNSMSEEKRSDFLLSLIRFANGKLAFNKDIFNKQLSLLQDFFNQMTE